MIERGPAIGECVRRAFNRVLEQTFEEVYDRVINDYGSVSDRTVHRHLAAMVKEGVLAREGDPGHATYRLVADVQIAEPTEAIQAKRRSRRGPARDKDATARLASGARARYAQRKMFRRCVSCDAGLQENDGVRCVECAEKYSVYTSAARAKKNDAYLARHRKWCAEHKEQISQQQADRRLERKLRGECLQCGRPSTDDSSYCEPHLESHRANSREYARKKRNTSDSAIAQQLLGAKWEVGR